MAAELVIIVSSVLSCATVAVALVSPCLREPITEAYNTFRKRKEKLVALKSTIEDLKPRWSEVERQSKGKVLSKSFKVSLWLKDAGEVTKIDADSMFKDQIDEISCCCVPNWITQYKAGRDVEEMIARLDALLKEGKKFIDVQESYVVGQRREVKEPAGKARSKVDKIMKHVRDKEVGTILVYGMAGSGKTEVVSRVNDLVLADYENSETEFQKVIWVNKELTEMSIENVQKKIAERLQVDLKATASRAETLEGALKKTKCLIILDGMLKNLTLEAIGIPRPTPENGLKVIIISRPPPAISNIKCDKKVEIGPLLDKEAEELFESEAHIDVLQLEKDTRAIIQQMVKECEGLPLAIVLLAQTLRDFKKDEDDGSWKDALYKLIESPSRMNEKAFNRLKDSYDMLTDDAKQCFLYCALYPSHHIIDKKKLVDYWSWEGLLDRTEARVILDELIGAYLVQKVSSPEATATGKEHFRMSNLVRHMAVHLTNTSPAKFLIQANRKLSKWHFSHHKQDLSEVERASLMLNQITSLMEEPKFPKLSTLLLQHNHISQLDDNFFRSMPNLKVLDLSHNPIQCLPKSASSNLTKLRALLLRGCDQLKLLPSLENSTELLVLDISYTPISQLPDGMKKLTNLIRLNLSHTNVRELQADVVHALVNLEELYMLADHGPAGSLWGSEKGSSSIPELRALLNLSALYINFLDAESFNRYVSSKKHRLSKFKVRVGAPSSEIEPTETFTQKRLPENSIVFSKSDFLVKGNPVSLPEDTSELHIMRNVDLSGLKVTGYLNSLKVIKMSNCVSLVCLFERDMLYKLPNLETIFVEKCPKMEALISKEDLPVSKKGPWANLKHISIADCESLVYLFRTEMLQYFPNLKMISISRHLYSKQVEKESEMHELSELLLVDPHELNKNYNGEMKSKPDDQLTIWTFAELNMEITTTLVSKPSLSKLMKRNLSFGEGIASPRGAMIRTLSGGNDDKGVLPPLRTPRPKPDMDIAETILKSPPQSAVEDQEEGLNLFSSAYLHMINYFVNPF